MTIKMHLFCECRAVHVFTFFFSQYREVFISGQEGLSPFCASPLMIDSPSVKFYDRMTEYTLQCRVPVSLKFTVDESSSQTTYRITGSHHYSLTHILTNAQNLHWPAHAVHESRFSQQVHTGNFLQTITVMNPVLSAPM